jgi:hypothetical protein
MADPSARRQSEGLEILRVPILPDLLLA